MVLSFVSSFLKLIVGSTGQIAQRSPACSVRHETARMTSAGVDKSIFDQKWRVYALRVPSTLTHSAVRHLKKHILHVPRVQVVRRSGKDDSTRLLLLRYFASTSKTIPDGPLGNMSFDESLIGEKERVADLVREPRRGTSSDGNVTKYLEQVSSDDLVEDDVITGYDHWSVEAILRKLLPENITMCVSDKILFRGCVFSNFFFD